MKDLIVSFVKSLGVTVMLSQKVFSDLLDFYCLNWLGSDDRYYSLLVPCNETQIFTAERLLLGEPCSGCAIGANLRVFATKQEWLDGRWSLSDAERADKVLAEWIRKKCNCCYEGYGYKVHTVVCTTRPFLSISVACQRGNDLAGSFTVTTGSVSVVRCGRDLALFISEVSAELGCSQFLQIETA